MSDRIANACALLMAAGVPGMKWRFRDGDPEATGS